MGYGKVGGDEQKKKKKKNRSDKMLGLVWIKTVWHYDV